MTSVISRRLLLLAALLALPRPADSDPRSNGLAVLQSDPRMIRIQKYFHEHDCPAQELAADFVAAADLHNLDWRLLPAISMVESTGGKSFMNNNWFGWDNCRVHFPSVREGIYLVGDQLANADWYREKSLSDVLRTYNPVPGYETRVRTVMRELGPAELPELRFQQKGH